MLHPGRMSLGPVAIGHVFIHYKVWVLMENLSIAVGCNSEPKYLLAGCNGCFKPWQPAIYLSPNAKTKEEAKNEFNFPPILAS